MPRSAHSALGRAAGLVLCSLLAVAPVSSQEVTPPTENSPRRAPRSGQARLVSTPPVIDGRLEDEAWKDGTPFSGFVMREPFEGQDATERTDVKIVTDGEALYIAAWMFDRDPSLIVPGEKIRDVQLTNSDYFAITLDTYNDRQNGFVFATTPAGVEYDGQIIREGEGGGVFSAGQNRMQAGAMGGFNVNWDASWTVRTSQDDKGWYAEFRIPFKTIRYGGGSPQTWGMNLVRSIRRKNEEVFWSYIPRQFNLYRMSLSGTLTELQVPVRRIATISPYVLSGARRDFSVDTKYRTPTEFGADAKYGLTPSLTLDLTYNTDFAQVEVDDQRVNLTRFPLFFPEKRPFFLENAGIFSAGTPQAVDLFFTRRIGIDNNGVQLPILGGGRVSGRLGGTTVGLLQIVTDEVSPTQLGQSYTVGRAIREVGRRSRVGLIGVQRMATSNSDDYNRTIGTDGRLGLGDAWTFDWWGAKTETPGREGDEYSWSARGAYQTRDWNNSVRFLQVGDAFNPEVGFLNRFGGYRFYEATTMRFFRKPEWKWFRQWNPHVSYRDYYGLDGFRQTTQWHVDFTEIEFNNGGRFGPEFNWYHEGLQTPFEIAPGITLPVGSYSWSSLGVDASTDPSANLSMVARGDFGPFWTGTRYGGNTTITWRSGSTISSSLLVDYNDVRLDEGNFTRSLVGVRFAYFFSPRIFLQTLTQYNNQQKIWGANLRFGWLNTAGTGLFIVYNEGQQADGFFQWQRPAQRSLILKYTKQFGNSG